MTKEKRDLTGEQFGRWTVLEPTISRFDSKGKELLRYKCQCSCGTIKDVAANTLIYGRSQSCGCLRIDQMRDRLIDIVGNQYGKLTVIKELEPRIDEHNRHLRYFECACLCGNKTVASYSNLIGGHTTSCGCLKYEKAQERRKYNKYDIFETYVQGYFNNNDQCFFADYNDYNLIKDLCWCLDGRGYVGARTESGDYIKMHRLIMNISDPSVIVDHIDGNPLNNCRSNLRLVNYSQNHMNRRVGDNNTSGIVGVNWHSARHQWRAYISIDHHTIHLGWFANKEDAIRARQEGERRYFGEYSYSASQAIAAQYAIPEIN